MVKVNKLSTHAFINQGMFEMKKKLYDNEKKLYDKTMRTNAKNEGAPARLDALWRQRRAGLWPQGCGRAPPAALPCPSRRP